MSRVDVHMWIVTSTPSGNGMDTKDTFGDSNHPQTNTSIAPVQHHVVYEHVFDALRRCAQSRKGVLMFSC